MAVFQSNLIYYPEEDYAGVPADIRLHYDDLLIPTSDGLSLGAWYVPSPKARGTILFCHGNAGNISHRLIELKLLNAMGFNVLMFDYRGYGQSEGRPSEEGTYLDAEAAWRYLVDVLEEKPERIVLFGRSLGGAVAIELATRHTPAALVVESTFTRLADVGSVHYSWLPVRFLLRHRYDSISRVGSIACPKLFSHGDNDQLIPIELGRKLFDAASSPKRLITTPGGHNNGGFTYSTRSAADLEEFLDSIGRAN